MKAIRVQQFGGPDVLRLEETPQPTPAAGQILVRIRAVGVNPIETYIRSGAYAATPPLPYTPGNDAAGIVETVGPGVTSFKSGDRVYMGGSLTGTYAEFALCDPAQIHPLPEKISFSQGAGVNTPYATAYRALFQRGHAVAGEVLLVHGATGGVGLATVQIARAAGLTVIGTGGTETGRNLVLAQGAHHVLDHRAPDYLSQLAQITNGHGVDIILEMLANVNLGKDLTVLARGGRVCVIGSRGPVEINPRDAMARDAAILGVMLYNATGTELAGIHQALFAGLENGSLRPVIAHELPLADAAEAHKAVMEPGAQGKIILLP